jgi:hypothetical protein
MRESRKNLQGVLKFKRFYEIKLFSIFSLLEDEKQYIERTKQVSGLFCITATKISFQMSCIIPYLFNRIYFS